VTRYLRYLDEPKKCITPPRSGSFVTDGQSFTADLHIHSEYSPDSACSLQELLNAAFDRRLQMIAITDHYVDRAFAELVRESTSILDSHLRIVLKHRTFLVIERGGKTLIVAKGKEVSTREGFHIIALAYIGQVHNFQSPVETLREIRAHQGIAIIPHPCNTFSHGIGAERLRRLAMEKDTADLIDAVEVFNANGLFPMFWNNRQSQSLAKIVRLPGIAVSDAHQARHIGRATTVFRGSLDLTSSSLFSHCLRQSLRTAGRDHVQRYVPLGEYFDWFWLPKLRALVQGKPVRIHPPPSYEDF
jgi:predicted metal-dependent phosphoesterase TrpH